MRTILPSNPLKVALIQFGAGRDQDANLIRVADLVNDAGAADLVALPEVFALRGGNEDYRAHADPIPGPLTSRLAALARRQNAWLLAGSLIEKAGNRIFNTSVLFDRQGDIAAVYRKIHLFEAELESGRVIREADIYEAGDTPVLARVEDWVCGMAICYDLRFPELFRGYSASDAHLMFVPSNFTQRTGRDHWEILVRARAIENQCFLVAPDQCGRNPVTEVESHGHSMAVGPWGEVLAEAGDQECALAVTLDPAMLAVTRHRVPALQHRRL